MKLKAPAGVGDPCVAGVTLAPRDGLYDVEAEIGALLIECFGFVEFVANTPAKPRPQPPHRGSRPQQSRSSCIRHGATGRLRKSRKRRSGTMAASDLAILADVKTWLAGSSGIGSSDDALFSRLITDVSGAITAYLGRPSLTPRTLTERTRRQRQNALVPLALSGAANELACHRQRRNSAAAPPATGAPRPAICWSRGMVCRPAGRRRSICLSCRFAAAGRTLSRLTAPVMRSRGGGDRARRTRAL